MSTIKILIADDNVQFAETLRDKLCSFGDFEIIGIANDGVEAIEYIEKFTPEVVLLDVIMPKLDGLGVLEYARVYPKENRPVFIVISAISQDSYISKALDLGANYYIVKPFNEEIIAQRIRQVFSDIQKDKYPKPKAISNVKKDVRIFDDELRILATRYMRECGLKAHMSGYTYIRDVIICSFDHYCQSRSLPKGIYRTIAEKHSISVQKVERAIRNCIEKGSNSYIVTDISSAKPLDIDGLAVNTKKPTNSQVVCKLIEKIRENN